MGTRKEFLIGTTLAVASPVLAGAEPAKTVAAATDIPPMVYSAAAFNALANKPARHRQCFGATKLSDGDPLFAMLNSMNAYEQTMGEGPGALYAVGVLYHGSAIGFALSDAVWNEYFIPALPSLPRSIRQQIGHPRAGKGNPYLRRGSNSAFGLDASVDALVARGAAFCVCNNAVTGFAYAAADALKKSPLDVYRRMVAGLVPGSLLVPAGVEAVNALQEAKFTYIQTTL